MMENNKIDESEPILSVAPMLVDRFGFIKPENSRSSVVAKSAFQFERYPCGCHSSHSIEYYWDTFFVAYLLHLHCPF